MFMAIKGRVMLETEDEQSSAGWMPFISSWTQTSHNGPFPLFLQRFPVCGVQSSLLPTINS